MLAIDSWSVTGTAAANTLAAATKAAVAGKTHYINAIFASYGVAAAAGLLQVKDGATVIHEQYVKDTVPLTIVLTRPIKGTAGNLVTAELAAGGAGAIGKVNLVGWTD